LRGAARTQLRSLSTGARSGALPGCAGEKARRVGGIDAAATVERARALAGELRPVVAELARAAREAGGDARDDRAAAPGPATRVGSSEECGRAGTGPGLHGCRSSAASAGSGRADPSGATEARDGNTGTL